MTLGSISDVPMICDTCGSTFTLGECEAKDAYDHGGPYEGEIGCPVPDCGGTMHEFGR
jgi:hypothetical protein